MEKFLGNIVEQDERGGRPKYAPEIVSREKQNYFVWLNNKKNASLKTVIMDLMIAYVIFPICTV